jgi:hypothetical protein
MIYQKTPTHIFAPRYILSGFPKSGLHLVEQMIKPIANPGSIKFQIGPWVGTFAHNSWVHEWVDMRPVFYKMAVLQEGHYLKGHVSYRKDIEEFMWNSCLSLVFIYRDLRDVAVSTAHHWMAKDQPRYRCEDKRFFHKMDFDDVLSAVITGIGPYPGIIERWADFAGWIDVDWVLKLQFEDLREDPEGCAEWLIQYGVKQVASTFGIEVEFDAEIHEKAAEMVKASKQTHMSPTFRKGAVGGWRDAFTDEHIKLFKQADKDGWLKKLGYESSKRGW